MNLNDAVEHEFYGCGVVRVLYESNGELEKVGVRFGNEKAKVDSENLEVLS